MSIYSIKELGLISGVMPHTIRIWEQRYGLLKPMRSESNIRYYDDEQLKKLLNVKQLLNAGIKISHIGNLSQREISSELDKILAVVGKEDTHFENTITKIIVSMATFDEALFEKVFVKCVQRFGLTKTYTKAVYPALLRTGLMWSKSDIMPVQEHFFSNLIKRKLFSSIDTLSIPKNPNQTWVLFLNEQEEHEIGLLFAYYILRRHNMKVIYLGGKVPYENLLNVARDCKATHIYTFLVKNHPEIKINKLIGDLCKDFKKVKICISGKVETLEKIELSKNIVLLKEVEDLTKLVE